MIGYEEMIRAMEDATAIMGEQGGDEETPAERTVRLFNGLGYDGEAVATFVLHRAATGLGNTPGGIVSMLLIGRALGRIEAGLD